MRIDGKARSKYIVKKLGRLSPPSKRLLGVLVGRDKSSLSFLKEKERVAGNLGVSFSLIQIPSSITPKELENKINLLARSPAIGGIVIELPLPAKFPRQRILDAVPPAKDPDCLSSLALGQFYTGVPSIRPLAVEAMEEVLRMIRYDMRGRKVVVIGSGSLIGKPISLWLWLQNKVAELTIVNRSTRNIAQVVKSADVVVSGAGHAHLIHARDVRPGTLVIDFGYDTSNGKIVGDFDPEGASADHRDIYYTPVPGCMGPLVIAKLFENFYRLNNK